MRHHTCKYHFHVCSHILSHVCVSFCFWCKFRCSMKDSIDFTSKVWLESQSIWCGKPIDVYAVLCVTLRRQVDRRQRYDFDHRQLVLFWKISYKMLFQDYAFASYVIFFHQADYLVPMIGGALRDGKKRKCSSDVISEWSN